MAKADEVSVVEAVRRRVLEFGEKLRSCPDGVDGNTPLPNLTWTVADLAQHVACLPNYWENVIGESDPFVVPDDFAAFSDQARAHITQTAPGELADLVETEFDSYLSDLVENPRQRWIYGRAATASEICGLAISELIVHGADLAAVTGAPKPAFTSDEAHAAVAGMMLTAPVFVDPVRAAAQPDGVYQVSFRGGRDYTWTKTGGTLSIAEGKPARADARMSADPAMFVLSSLGRVGQVRAGLSGKIVSYGRRPWRFLGLGTMLVDGV